MKHSGRTQGDEMELHKEVRRIAEKTKDKEDQKILYAAYMRLMPDPQPKTETTRYVNGVLYHDRVYDTRK